MIDALMDFHFLRIAYLLFLIPIAGLWWAARPKRSGPTELPSGVAPHLAVALRLGGEEKRRIYPIDPAFPKWRVV